MRLAPRSIMQLVDRLHFYLSSSSKPSLLSPSPPSSSSLTITICVVATIFVVVTYGHKPPFLGTTCMLVRGDSNLQPSGWSVPPLPLHQHITSINLYYFSLLNLFIDKIFFSFIALEIPWLNIQVDGFRARQS